MEALLIYSLKVSFALILFYLVYVLFLRNDTFFRLRRGYFLFALIFSLLFPFILLEFSDAKTNIPVTVGFMLSEIEVFVGNQFHGGESSQLSSFMILVYTSIVGSVFFLMRLLVQMGGLYYHLKGRKWVQVGHLKLNYLEKGMLSSFSFFHWVVINTTQQTDRQLQDVLKHESIHACQLHSIDVLLYELFSVVFWWNPFTWLMKSEMKLNLEYLADQGVLKDASDNKEYQYTLLQINMVSTGMTFINNFNVLHLKKRIIMMNKERTSIVNMGKYILVLPVVFALIMGNVVYSSNQEGQVQDSERKAYDITEQTQKAEKKIYEIVEQMPTYEGGTNAMMKYIRENLEYPKTAEDAGIQGRVIIRFVITEIGNVDNISVLRGIDSACDQEAVRVVKAMPKWIPGKQNGEAVSVYYNLPILFNLQKDEKKE